MRTREPRRIEGKPGSRNGRVSKKAPNEPKKVRKDFRRENGSTQGGILPRKVAFCSLAIRRPGQLASNEVFSSKRRFLH